MSPPRWIASTLAALLVVLAGCSSGGNPAEAPSGWQTSETRWWKAEVDTATAFRNLGTLQEMGFAQEELSVTQTGLTQEQFNNAIKRSLIKLYRNNPEVVDSLFEARAVDSLRQVDLNGDIVTEEGRLKMETENEYKNKAYKAINKVFREPQPTKSDVQMAYPESLRTEEASGRVELQVHLATQEENGEVTGVPNAIEVIEGTHPTLNAIAMKGATKRRWNPAYVQVDREWQPVDSWVRFSINFPAPQ